MRIGRSLSPALLGCLFLAAQLSAQHPTGSVEGRVVDGSTLEPLPGVAVVVAERGALTDANGRFRIGDVPVGPQTVRARLVGYADGTRQVTVADGQSVTVNFALTPEALALQEMVVIGYGQQQAADITGAVATVTPEEFNTGRVVSPEQLIQAKVAGVQIIDSGEPGGVSSIRIRGGTSVNASSEPLLVVDGIPLPPGGGLSAGRSPLNFINPDDIQSMTVLKDAASTAIYGSRGANGVILIETKSGEARGPQFSYNGSVSSSSAVGEANVLTADEFRQAVASHTPDRMAYLGSANTDWRDAVLQTAPGQEHSMAIAGAGEDVNYRLSLGYLGQDGVVRNSTVERVTASLNYDHRLFENRVNLRASLRGARTDDTFSPGGAIGQATVFDPTQPIRTESGYFEQTEFVLGPNNPVAELEHVTDEGTTYRTIANVEAEYRPAFFEALTGTVRLGYDVAKSERRVFVPSTLQSQIESPLPGFFSRSNPTETTGVLDAFLTYGTALPGIGGDVDATAGYSYETSHGDYPYFQAVGLESDLLGTSGVPSAAEYTPSVFERENRLASFFGRVNYSLRDRYVVSLSVRRDGSSRFAPGNQWGTFPAAGIAWRVSEEAFMPAADWLSDLKLRASWGVNGNQAIGDYLWVADYRYSDDFSRVQFGDEFVTTIRPTAVDPNIKWEETSSYNIGVDYGLFGNRVSGSIEYYFKDTEDLIFRVPVAAGAYVSNRITTNVGSVQNRGLELSLDADMLDRATGGLSWTASFNASTNSNELVRINPFGGGGEEILVGGIAGGVGSTIQVLRPGEAINTFLVYRHKRDASGRPVYSENLLDMYEDQATDPCDAEDPSAGLCQDGEINQDDRVPFENPTPSWIFGHTSHFAYRNVDLSFTVRAHRGNYVYNNLASSQGYYNRLNEAAGPINLHRSVLDNGFVAPQFFSDVYVEDASFIRMDNLTLGFTLPRLYNLQQVRVYGTLQNVFTHTDYTGVDPEAGLNGIDNTIYPRSRTFTAGVNVGL